MTSFMDVDLERQWTWRCTSSYTAVVGVAQLQNVKLAQKPNVANTPGSSINPRAALEKDLPRGSECVVMEIAMLSYRVCMTLLNLLQSDRPRIERCTYCGDLYLPDPGSHRHDNNFCCDKHRQRYRYENL